VLWPSGSWFQVVPEVASPCEESGAACGVTSGALYRRDRSGRAL